MATNKKTSFSEFNTYCKCPLLWKSLYVNNQKILRKATYKDLVYKSDVSNINTIGMEESIIKADAIKNYIAELSEDICLNEKIYHRAKDIENELTKPELSITCSLTNGDDVVLELPTPTIYKNEKNELFILSTTITSNSLDVILHDDLANLQSIALSLSKHLKVKVLKRIIHPAALRKKKAETDAEFEARRAELIKKSKTGTSKAQKQLGETREEFYKRYKEAITVEYKIESNNENEINSYQSELRSKLNEFARVILQAYDVTINNHYCMYCDLNTQNGCPCISPFIQDNVDGMIKIEKRS